MIPAGTVAEAMDGRGGAGAARRPHRRVRIVPYRRTSARSAGRSPIIRARWTDQLKARLIGASVLVLLAVLLIPELLSARKPAADATGSAKRRVARARYTIDLGGAVRRCEARAAPAPAAAETVARHTRAAIEEPAAAGCRPVARRRSRDSSRDDRSRDCRRERPAAASHCCGQHGRPQNRSPTSVPATTPTVPVTNPAPAKGQWAVQVGAFGSADERRQADRRLAARRLTAPTRRHSTVPARRCIGSASVRRPNVPAPTGCRRGSRSVACPPRSSQTTDWRLC